MLEETYRRTDGQTDKASYRVACPQLKNDTMISANERINRMRVASSKISNEISKQSASECSMRIKRVFVICR